MNALIAFLKRKFSIFHGESKPTEAPVVRIIKLPTKHLAALRRVNRGWSRGAAERKRQHQARMITKLHDPCY